MDVVDVKSSVLELVMVVGFRRYGWMELPVPVVKPVMVPPFPLAHNMLVFVGDKKVTAVVLDVATVQVLFNPVATDTPAIVIWVPTINGVEDA